MGAVRTVILPGLADVFEEDWAKTDLGVKEAKEVKREAKDEKREAKEAKESKKEAEITS